MDYMYCSYIAAGLLAIKLKYSIRKGVMAPLRGSI